MSGDVAFDHFDVRVGHRALQAVGNLSDHRLWRCAAADAVRQHAQQPAEFVRERVARALGARGPRDRQRRGGGLFRRMDGGGNAIAGHAARLVQPLQSDRKLRMLVNDVDAIGGFPVGPDRSPDRTRA